MKCLLLCQARTIVDKFLLNFLNLACIDTHLAIHVAMMSCVIKNMQWRCTIFAFQTSYWIDLKKFHPKWCFFKVEKKNYKINDKLDNNAPNDGFGHFTIINTCLTFDNTIRLFKHGVEEYLGQTSRNEHKGSFFFSIINIFSTSANCL